MFIKHSMFKEVMLRDCVPSATKSDCLSTMWKGSVLQSINEADAYVEVQVRELIDVAEYQMIVQSLANMVESLDNAKDDARDDIAEDPIPVTMQVSMEGMGRPRLEIEQNWLMYALQVQTVADIAKELGCSWHTVRRRILDYGLALPTPAVIQQVVRQDGTLAREWHPRGPTMSALNEDPGRLDAVIQDVLEAFPTYGLAYLTGALKSMGHHVSRANISASYHRVTGVRAQFMHRPVERRVYSVPYVNSLWHHDGNHSEMLALLRDMSLTMPNIQN